MDTYSGTILGSDDSKLGGQSGRTPGDGVVVAAQRVLRVYEESIIRELLLVYAIHNHILRGPAREDN